MSDTLFPSVVILASRFDLACDYVVARLRARSVPYLRLNTEDLPDSRITFDPFEPRLSGNVGTRDFCIDRGCLKSILFRRPVFLREAGDAVRPPGERLARFHWATFMRSFMTFDWVTWVNHPAATYQGENKVVQLLMARQVGLAVPRTIVSNDRAEVMRVFHKLPAIAIKGLDVVLIREGDFETFGYTNVVPLGDIAAAEISAYPVIAQEALHDKLDLRVTVVGEELFCAAATVGDRPISGDWRLQKNNVRWSSFDLPDSVAAACVALVGKMGLSFGAIDLAQRGREFFFLEINPTGEWAWLVDEAGLQIDETIARYLSGT